jgi:hypothetical protein
MAWNLNRFYLFSFRQRAAQQTDTSGRMRDSGTIPDATPASSGGRQMTVDILRGYFILSMASGHVGAGLVTSLLHAWRWVDGACGFVALSAFVLGLSQRARWDRGQGSAQNWILRRTLHIWLASFVLTFAGLSLRVIEPDLTFIADVFHRETILRAIADAAALRLWVDYFGMLRMYVYFLAFAYLAVSLLKRGLDAVVIGLSAALYLLVQLDTVNPDLGWGAEPVALGSFSVAAWQFLFFVGLVAGWRWKETCLPFVRRWRTAIVAVSGLGLVFFLWLAHAYKFHQIEPYHPGDLTPWFDKFNLSPPVLIYFACVLGFLPAVIGTLRRLAFAERALRIVALIGRHSLACYLLLCFVQAMMWLVAVPADAHGGKHWAWFPAAVLLFVGYAALVERGRVAPVPRRDSTEALPV